MAGRARVRRAAKWALVALTVLITAAWLASLRYNSGVISTKPDGRLYLLATGPGGVVGAHSKDPSLARADAAVWFLAPPPTAVWGEHVWLPCVLGSASIDSVVLPFWLLLLMVAAPSAWLWFRDRRLRLGYCPCGYALAGLPAGAPCPECGKPEGSARA